MKVWDLHSEENAGTPMTTVCSTACFHSRVEGMNDEVKVSCCFHCGMLTLRRCTYTRETWARHSFFSHACIEIGMEKRGMSLHSQFSSKKTFRHAGDFSNFGGKTDTGRLCFCGSFPLPGGLQGFSQEELNGEFHQHSG